MTTRRKLPNRRHAETFDLVHGRHDSRFKVTVGYYPDDRVPAEVFVSGAKVGTDIEAVARDAAVLLSIALQYGVPLAVIGGAITREQDGTPSTIMGAVVDRLCEPARPPEPPELVPVPPPPVPPRPIPAEAVP